MDTTIETNDTFGTFRVEKSPACRDGRPYFLTLVQSEAGCVAHRWDLGFSTEIGAQEAAHALIAAGYCTSVYVNEIKQRLNRRQSWGQWVNKTTGEVTNVDR